jgi:TolA-binding protein
VRASARTRPPPRPPPPQTYKTDLQQEQDLKAQVEEKLQTKEEEVGQLETKAAELQQDKTELKMQNTVLMLENVILSDTRVKLERRAAELASENEDLHSAVRVWPPLGRPRDCTGAAVPQRSRSWDCSA